MSPASAKAARQAARFCSTENDGENFMIFRFNDSMLPVWCAVIAALMGALVAILPSRERKKK
jgi:hypothetical protein